MKNHNTIPPLGEEIYYPRTPADKLQACVWAAKLPRSQVIERFKNPDWRSRVEIFMGHSFCIGCGQLIAKHCEECGQGILAHLPTITLLLPTPSGARTYLENVTEHLLKRKVSPRNTLEIIQSLNLTRGNPPLHQIEVEMIFNKAGEKEINRRRGA